MKKIYSINTTPYGHFKYLEVVEEDLNKVDIKDMNDFIYFLTEKEATDFLNKLKLFIKNNYPRAIQDNWYQ